MIGSDVEFYGALDEAVEIESLRDVVWRAADWLEARRSQYPDPFNAPATVRAFMQCTFILHPPLPISLRWKHAIVDDLGRVSFRIHTYFARMARLSYEIWAAPNQITICVVDMTALVAARTPHCRAACLALFAAAPFRDRNVRRMLARALWVTRRDRAWQRERARYAALDMGGARLVVNDWEV